MKSPTASEAPEPASPNSAFRLLGDIHDVLQALNVCRSVVENLLRNDPEFPAPMDIAKKRQWFMDEIEQYKATRPRRVYTTAVAVVAVAIIAVSFLFSAPWA